MINFIDSAIALAETVKTPAGHLPFVKATPLFSMTHVSSLEAKETMQVMIESRGHDGAYTKSFTEVTLWSKQI